jgi:hypothetical protein
MLLLRTMLNRNLLKNSPNESLRAERSLPASEISWRQACLSSANVGKQAGNLDLDPVLKSEIAPLSSSASQNPAMERNPMKREVPLVSGIPKDGTSAGSASQ